MKSVLLLKMYFTKYNLIHFDYVKTCFGYAQKIVVCPHLIHSCVFTWLAVNLSCQEGFMLIQTRLKHFRSSLWARLGTTQACWVVLACSYLCLGLSFITRNQTQNDNIKRVESLSMTLIWPKSYPEVTHGMRLCMNFSSEIRLFFSNLVRKIFRSNNSYLKCLVVC